MTEIYKCEFCNKIRTKYSIIKHQNGLYSCEVIDNPECFYVVKNLKYIEYKEDKISKKKARKN